MTTPLFREDAYLTTCNAVVVGLNERGGILTDQTVCYATAGGQPGDRATMSFADQTINIATTVYDEAKDVVHVPTEGAALPAIGDTVTISLDWNFRHRIMRCHSMMHLLCAAVPFPVTGSSLTDDGGRIDFDIPDGETPDKLALQATINEWIKQDHAITTRWITDVELDARPELVRTLLVKPPRGSGKIRLVLIGDEGKIDMQPCGGTHVKSLAEIGEIIVVKIESKGKINRRIRLQLVNP